jgi:hypothetical protein
MNDLTEFFGWCTAINLALLFFASVFVSLAREWMIAMHSRILGVKESELPGAYLQYLSNYKIAVLVLNLVPYVSLKLMS